MTLPVSETFLKKGFHSDLVGKPFYKYYLHVNREKSELIDFQDIKIRF